MTWDWDKLVLRICQFFCTVPANFDMSVSGGTARSCDFRTAFATVLHMAWCLLVFVGICNETYFQHLLMDAEMTTIEKQLYLSEYVFNILTIAIVMIAAYKNKSFNEQLLRAHFALKRKATFVCMGQKSCETRKLRVMVACSLAFYTFEFLYAFAYYGFDLVPIVRSLTVYMVPNIIMTISQIQHVTLLGGILENLERINLTLEKVNYPQSQLSQIQANQAERGMNAVLHNLRAYFTDLDELLKQVSEAFGLITTSIFVGAFFILSNQFFDFYRMIGDADGSVSGAVFTLAWIVLHGAKFLVVLTANNDILREKITTVFLLNNIETTSADTELTINRFLIQLKSQNRCQAAFCGIIELDTLLVGGIFGALATYLIFLIQLDLSEVTLRAAGPDTKNCSVIH